MKVLFIGGTGNISTSVSKLAVDKGIELTLLNRGRRGVEIPGARTLSCDINQPSQVRHAIRDMRFDAVVDWIAFTANDVERDIELFKGRTGQYIFISSASAYQKPPVDYLITESTPLHNPYWAYSRNKIACEERLQQAYRDEGFPICIVRPSLTYATVFPIAIGGWGCYTLADRLFKGKPIIVHGDGSSLWVVTHAEDFAKGFVGLLGHPQTLGHAFHITTDQVLTWNQIYQGIADALGVQANIVHIPCDWIAQHSPQMGEGLIGDKAWSVVFDNTKIKRFVPGFRATIPYHEGIRKTLAWFDEDERRKWIDEAVNIEMDDLLTAYAKV
jgi:nucleoside-diphosphate-sugar epimerase